MLKPPNVCIGIPQRKNRIGALIYFHGAGFNIGYNVTQAHWLRKLGFDVLLAEYRRPTRAPLISIPQSRLIPFLKGKLFLGQTLHNS